MKRILILGGYGNFGKRIVENLADIEDIEILVAGRNKAKAQSLIRNLSYTGHPFSAFRQGKEQKIYGWMEPRKNDAWHPGLYRHIGYFLPYGV